MAIQDRFLFSSSITGVALAVFAFAASANAAVIVSTDFTGRTVSGNVASNITYTLTGVQDPGDLTAIEVQDNPTVNLTGLFNTTAAQGHFAPDLNTDNEDNWSVTVPLAFKSGIESLTVDDVELVISMFSNAGGLQLGSTNTHVAVSFVGSTSGAFQSEQLEAVGPSDSLSFFASTPTFTLSGTETWQLVIATTEYPGSPGNNTGLNSFAVNGAAAAAAAAVPEPSTFCLASLGLLGLIGYTRRKR